MPLEKTHNHSTENMFDSEEEAVSKFFYLFTRDEAQNNNFVDHGSCNLFNQRRSPRTNLRSVESTERCLQHFRYVAFILIARHRFVNEDGVRTQCWQWKA